MKLGKAAAVGNVGRRLLACHSYDPRSVPLHVGAQMSL